MLHGNNLQHRGRIHKRMRRSFDVFERPRDAHRLRHPARLDRGADLFQDASRIPHTRFVSVMSIPLWEE